MITSHVDQQGIFVWANLSSLGENYGKSVNLEEEREILMSSEVVALPGMMVDDFGEVGDESDEEEENEGG